MSETIEADVAVIGAGSAGMRAYREVAKTTDRVLLIEGERYGTTCARIGCMPSKLLIAAAEAAGAVRGAGLFGVRAAEPEIDGRAVMRRVREERDRFAGHVVETVEGWPERHRIMARARFEDDRTLALSDGRRLRADRVVIATGSRPSIPQPFEAFGDRLATSDDVFSWEDLPRSVAVFGAGVVGLELGQALARLGVRATLFGKGGQVGVLTDPDCVEAGRRLVARTMPFHPDHEARAYRRTGDGVEVEHVVDGESVAERFDLALVATGRRPNVDGLGLETTSLALDGRGVPDFDHQTGRCGESGIYVAGDANARLPLLHEAADEGMIAGYNAARHPDARRFVHASPIRVMFTDPQIATVGESHAALTARGADFRAGSVDWSDQGRARVMGVNAGLLRVYGERATGRFLGAEMIGPRAEHLAHLLAWSHQSRLTVGEMLARPFYHPCFEEGLRTALRACDRALGMGPAPPPRCIDCGPGG